MNCKAELSSGKRVRRFALGDIYEQSDCYLERVLRWQRTDGI
jgi:hypothetical protein